MADEKNTDVKATSEELNDEALNETSGGFEIHNKYIMWSIKCLDWECGAVDAPILPIGQMPERKCFKCGGTNVDVNPTTSRRPPSPSRAFSAAMALCAPRRVRCAG